MDVGKFKAGRARLMLWIVLPPLIITGVGLSAYALRLQSEWEHSRTRLLSAILPELVQTQNRARNLLAGFHGSNSASIRSEDEFISFIQEVEQKSRFTVDSLKVERRVLGDNTPVLVASVKGFGSFEAIREFLGDVVSGQHLLYESSLQVSQTSGSRNADIGDGQYKVDMTFELVLLESLKTIAEGGK